MKFLLTICLIMTLMFSITACGDIDDPGPGASTPLQGDSPADSGNTGSTPDSKQSSPDASGDPGSSGNDGSFLISAGRYSYIDKFYDGIAIAQIGDFGDILLTAIDSAGNELFEPTGKYASIRPFGFGVAVVEGEAQQTDTGMGVGLIDLDGNEIVPPGKYSRFFTDITGRFGDTVVVAEITGLTDGLYAFDYAVIDNKGNEIVPAGRYSAISEFVDGVAVVRDYFNNYSIIDKDGNELIAFGEYMIDSFSDGAAIVTTPDYLSWGVIDTSGNLSAPLRERDPLMMFSAFCNDVATVSAWVADRYHFGVIDKSGEFIIPVSPQFSRINDFHDGSAVARDADDYYGVIDKAGNTVVPFGKYFMIEPFVDGFARVFDSDNRQGFIDLLGNEVIPVGMYDGLGLFVDGYMIFQTDGNNIVLDSSGTELYNKSLSEGHIFSVSADGLMVIGVQDGAAVIRLH